MSYAKPQRSWQIFAIVMLVLVLPFEFGGLFRNPAPAEAARYAMDTFAVIGVLGYAFMRPLGPYMFWRVFAVGYLADTIYRLALSIAGLATLPSGKIGTTVVVAAAAMMLPLLTSQGFIILALMRKGGWFQPTTDDDDVDAVFR